MTTSSSDDHRDAHLVSLRLALGSIVAPKRPTYARTTSACSTPGTATPAPHAHHRVPSPSSSTLPSPSSTPGTPVLPLPSISTTAHPAVAPLPSPSPPTSVAAGAVNAVRARVGLVGTLQSKSAFDALVHGAWL
ncbi:hypothetical protein C8Q72DRAFT_650421 [Fomitopsis betulina]|nr:hypothetical protein C8Q72DRAFT_650421 [Fomitopsis betulina]